MNKPVLITGAAGFVGARFVESCALKSWPVISVDLEKHFQDRAEHQGLKFGEIIDRDKLFDTLDSKKPPLQAIVHVGACTDTTQMDVAYLTKVNLEYSKRLWNYASQNRVPFVYASSAATYGEGELGFDDDEALIPKLKPLNPYGQSKQDFDLWAMAEEKKGNAPPSWSGFKFFNVYGFGERHKGKMASVALHAFDQIKASGRIKLFKSHKAGIADGHQKRDFIYVEDVVEVLHFALSKPIKRGIFNLGTGKARTFLDFTAGVFREMNLPPRIEFIPTPEAIRERYQYLTEAKMERLRREGFEKAFTAVEWGVSQYIRRLKKS